MLTETIERSARKMWTPIERTLTADSRESVFEKLKVISVDNIDILIFAYDIDILPIRMPDLCFLTESIRFCCAINNKTGNYRILRKLRYREIIDDPIFEMYKLHNVRISFDEHIEKLAAYVSQHIDISKEPYSYDQICQYWASPLT